MRPSATHRTFSEWSRRCIAVLAAVLALLPQEVPAHDPDFWGGLFRTQDSGITWSPINPGIFPSGALALAISPRDPNHLLLATDSGVWRSRNGGRDWDVEAQGILTGPAFAAAFDVDGERALVAGSSTLYRDEGDRWRPVRTPAAAAPARALVAGSVPGRVYLAGRSGLYRSDDWGQSWVNMAGTLKANHVDALLVRPGRPDEVYVLVGGSVWSSGDGAGNWQRRAEGVSASGVEAVGIDPSNPAHLWAVGAGQVFRSDHQGAHWRPVGKPVPEPRATARAAAVWGNVILIATDRGVFRSADGGERWELPNESLPAHLAAGVLVRDSRRPATLYAGFALTTYEELRARALQNETASSGFGLGSIAGGTAFVVLLALGVITAMRRLARTRRRTPDADASHRENRSIDQTPR